MEVLGSVFGRSVVARHAACPPAGARPDDVLDAFAGAWTALRVAVGIAHATGGRARRARVAHGGGGLTRGPQWLCVPVALFDLDNTLYDREGTIRRWAAAYVEGRPDPAGEVEWLCEVDGDGMTDRTEMWTQVRRRYGLDTPVPELVARYRREYLDALEPDPRSHRALGLLRDAGWRIGVVTNGPMPHQAHKAERPGSPLPRRWLLRIG